MLGWDNLDTPLHLDDVADELVEHLAWPADDDEWDDETWRETLALRLHAAPPRGHHDLEGARRSDWPSWPAPSATASTLCSRSRPTTGPLTKLMKAFQEALVHDLDADGFADMYAQTIAYGLLSARIADPHEKTADDFAAHMPSPTRS